MADRQLRSTGNYELPKDIIRVNWVFPQKKKDPECVDISRSQFTSPARQLRTLFAQELLEIFGFQAASNAAIRFFKPKRAVTVYDTFEAAFTWDANESTPIPAIKTLSSFISDTVEDEDLVDLVVKADLAGLPPMGGVLTELPALQRYQKIVQTRGPPPSTAAKSYEYSNLQKDSATAIHDGRLSRAGPPLEIFHPIFRLFLGLVRDPSHQPLPSDILGIQELFHYNSTIIAESTRNSELLPLFAKLLGCTIAQYVNPDGTIPDAMYVISVDGMTLAALVLELRNELGDGGCDPSTQAGHSMRCTWIQNDERKRVRDKCCCPTFLLAGGGPWITVMGAVITDKVIVQRLTDMMWLAESSTEEAGRVYRAARVFSALRLSLSKLKEYYEGVAENDKIPPLIDSSHPRFYPYPTHYVDRLTSEKVEFTYVKPLEQSDNCVTFLARSNITRNSLVVKFVSRYGVEVHDLLAEEGYAPRLRYHGSLDDDDKGDELLSERPDSALERGIGQAPDGLFVGPLKMVVMDFITTPPSPKTVQPSDPHRRQVEEVLCILHRAGYVFGDLRSSNVLIDIQGKVKFIDFNWTGRYNVRVQDDGDLVPEDVQRQINEFAAKANGGGDGGVAPASEERYAHYPYNINKAIKWHADVGPMKPIRPAHDWFMVEKLWSDEL
ncbi:hypothetical protein EST38_g1381 [Candolleomyces aberdarensis]|uniref:Protein kinase domain-containing protein n=1 Tax=Candolleomyces aberdarensis TaxID=2316362 RepID=A0A4Q2DXL7_9AGAR|nr:hypothetical protein EST38_g1381 [Candolleomyces aberdarensis]